VTAAERAETVLEPRDAATVMLVRDVPDLHVFMLRRNLDSVWIAGASVFPGGAVDDADRHRSWTARCADWDDVRASRAIGVGAGGLGFFVAAVRETFEEAGVLLAAAPPGEYLHDDTELIASAWVRPRDALVAAARGEIDLIFPTQKNLELLARFERAGDVLTAARAGAPARDGRLRLVAEPSGGRRIALPDDVADGGMVPCPS
jgi:8-oxo-dGTP pyrophosphatase MutT (NUDIX family)